MKNDKHSFSSKRIEEQARAADVIQRAKAVTNPALQASRDILNDPTGAASFNSFPAV